MRRRNGFVFEEGEGYRSQPGMKEVYALMSEFEQHKGTPVPTPAAVRMAARKLLLNYSRQLISLPSTELVDRGIMYPTSNENMYHELRSAFGELLVAQETGEPGQLKDARSELSNIAEVARYTLIDPV